MQQTRFISNFLKLWNTSREVKFYDPVIPSDHKRVLNFYDTENSRQLLFLCTNFVLLERTIRKNASTDL